MKQILNTALVYISNFMSVNAVMFEQGKGQFFLPSPYAADYDNSIVTQQLKNAPNNSVLHVQDSSLVHYCFAFISNYILLIGPFRVQSLNMDMLPDYLSNDSRLRGKYLHYYYSLPLLSEESVKQSLHLLFVSIYGNSDSIEENTVRIHIYRKNEILIPLDFPDSVSEEIEASELEMAMQLLDQLQSGNTSMVLSLYRKIMRQKSSTFVLINTVEGLSTIRTIAKIAMRKAGIPASCPCSMTSNLRGVMLRV